MMNHDLPFLSREGIFDSHAHYFDRRFAEETAGADAILENEVFGQGVAGVINVGTSNENSRICVAQAAKYPNMYAAVGLHPEDVHYGLGSLDDELSALAELLGTADTRKRDKIVALGEIGLDYHVENADKKRQAAFFEAQLIMAEERELPVIIHDRDAHGDCFETVLRHPNVRGVFHSFSGSAEMARELIRRGWYISFSGVLTFKNARKTLEVAQSVPHDRILVETDAPYLAPVPFRGRINHSGLVCHTLVTLSGLLGLSYEETVALTADNAKTLFGIENEKSNLT